jgi:hypothetical protein
MRKVQIQFASFDSEFIQKIRKFQIHITALSKHNGQLEPLEINMPQQMALP